MSLAARLGGAFRDVVRRRGEAYARSGKVAIVAADAEAAAARVRGSGGARYEVEIGFVERAGSTALGVGCTCPHFAGGELCKHLWATLRVLDRQGWAPASLPADDDGSGLELLELDLADDDEDEIDRLPANGELRAELERLLSEESDDSFGDELEPSWTHGGEEEEPWRIPDAAARQRRDGRGVSPSASWRTRVARLASPVPGSPGPRTALGVDLAPLASSAGTSQLAAPGELDERAAALAGAEPPILYVLDPEQVRREQKVRVSFARRSVRKDGSLGPLRPAGLDVAELGTAEGPVERAARMQLLTLAQAHAAAEDFRGFGYRKPTGFRGHPERPSAVVVPMTLVDPLLPRLAETGRLAVLHGGLDAGPARLAGRGRAGAPSPAVVEGDVAPTPRRVYLDPGPPWELRLELAPAADPSASSSSSGASLGDCELRGRFVRGGAVSEETLGLDEPDLVLAGGLLLRDDTLARAEVGWHTGAVSELRAGPVRIPAAELDAAVVALSDRPGLPPLDLGARLPWRERPGAPTPRLRFEDMRDAGALAAHLDFGYGGAWIGVQAAARRVADTRERTLFVRDRQAEATALQVLAELGFHPHRDPRRLATPRAAAAGAGAGADGRGDVPTLAIARDRFESAVEHLLAKGWRLEADGARLRSASRTWARVRSGVDFFDLEGGIDFEGEQVGFPALLAAAREQSEAARFVRLGDGSRGLLPRAWIERCAGIAALGEPLEEEEGDGAGAKAQDEAHVQGMARPGAGGAALRFSRAQVGLLGALLDAQDEARSDRRFADLRRSLESFRGISAAREPAGFRGSLRGYQREGLAWLRFLRRFGLGGCLADDMGLGKTVQVLALLAGLRRPRGGERRPCLVVAPRSVVHGWLAEAERFAPRLRAVRYTGAERRALRPHIEGRPSEGTPRRSRDRLVRAGPRDRLHRAHGIALVVTTYGTLRRDVDWLREQRFDTVVLDEAQAIKNADSRTARAARELRADHRLALTGTPVENHLGELASLLRFLNPGILGRARGLDALASGHGAGSAPRAGARPRGRAAGRARGKRTNRPWSAEPGDLALLSRALRPLLLRRTKEQVLRELPPRTEQLLLCALPSAQRRRYDELRRHYQASLTRRVEAQGLARSKIHVLEALLRLRQAACHVALLDPRLAREPSAKLQVLFEHLEEILAEGHKALVFSQFTKLLALVRQGLEAREIPYAYLDGRTRDRKARVARFQEDPDCGVFAISLKAGGTGLNLTAADYVFLLDPWWNPAVEAQAIDRTHRIGQTRPVVAYRLVAENTVEEKILELQEHKRALSRAVLGDEKGFVGQLSAEDLRYLLG